MPALRNDPPPRGAEPLPALPGTYLLWLRVDKPARVAIGALGVCAVEPGWYGYVGSARGPGGLAARVGRHLLGDKPLRWHVDYLRRIAVARAVWFRTGVRNSESLWADTLARLPGATAPWPGFGASDHRGATHLHRFDSQPACSRFRQELEALPEAVGDVTVLNLELT